MRPVRQIWDKVTNNKTYPADGKELNVMNLLGSLVVTNIKGKW